MKDRMTSIFFDIVKDSLNKFAPEEAKKLIVSDVMPFIEEWLAKNVVTIEEE
jgi:hypothetical protein